MGDRAVYLKSKSGDPIGPLPMRAIEVLYDARVIDETTPISQDGEVYSAVRDLTAVHMRLLDVKKQITSGANPWERHVSFRNEEPEAIVEPEASEAPPEAPNSRTTRPLAAILRAALAKATGRLTLSSSEGSLTVDFKEGKIGAISTDIDALELGAFLVSTGVTTEEAIRAARARSPQLGGDLGAALIANGVVPPHTYFEKFVAWAKKALGSIAAMDFDSAVFAPMAIPSSPVPLGLDRLGIVMELIRDNAKSEFIEAKLLEHKNCVLIPSQVEGLSLEDLKLKARELRVMNMINGTKTLAELLDALGGSQQKSAEVLQTVYFGVETGLIVVGEDPSLGKEIAEAAKLRERLLELKKKKKKNLFEILGIKDSASDEETRARYTELVKQYHPDTLRQGCAPELLGVRRELFDLVAQTFEALDTSEKRSAYAVALKEGRADPEAEREKVQALVKAETLFKKADTFAKARKLKEAVEHLDEAIKLNPDDVEFKVYREYHAFVLAGYTEQAAVDEGEKVAKAILQLVKNKEPLLAAHLFVGNILLRYCNRPDAAVKQFRKVLEIDEKHIEATREIRLYNARKDKKKSLF